MTSSMPSCCSRRRSVENCRPAVPSMPVTRLHTVTAMSVGENGGTEAPHLSLLCAQIGTRYCRAHEFAWTRYPHIHLKSSRQKRGAR